MKKKLTIGLLIALAFIYSGTMLYFVNREKRIAKATDVAIEIAKDYKTSTFSKIEDFDFLEENMDVKQIQSSTLFNEEEKEILIKAIDILREKKDMMNKVELNERR